MHTECSQNPQAIVWWQPEGHQGVDDVRDEPRMVGPRPVRKHEGFASGE